MELAHGLLVSGETLGTLLVVPFVGLLVLQIAASDFPVVQFGERQLAQTLVLSICPLAT